VGFAPGNNARQLTLPQESVLRNADQVAGNKVNGKTRSKGEGKVARSRSGHVNGAIILPIMALWSFGLVEAGMVTLGLDIGGERHDNCPARGCP